MSINSAFNLLFSIGENMKRMIPLFLGLFAIISGAHAKLVDVRGPFNESFNHARIRTFEVALRPPFKIECPYNADFSQLPDGGRLVLSCKLKFATHEELKNNGIELNQIGIDLFESASVIYQDYELNLGQVPRNIKVYKGLYGSNWAETDKDRSFNLTILLQTYCELNEGFTKDKDCNSKILKRAIDSIRIVSPTVFARITLRSPVSPIDSSGVAGGTCGGSNRCAPKPCGGCR